MTKRTSPQTLLPCPFCGKAPEDPVELRFAPGIYCMIHRCKILGPVKFEGALESISKTWNTRARVRP